MAAVQRLLSSLPSAVTKGSNVIQLDVDTEGSHLVGVSPSSHVHSHGTLFVGGVPGKYC